VSVQARDHRKRRCKHISADSNQRDYAPPTHPLTRSLNHRTSSIDSSIHLPIIVSDSVFTFSRNYCFNRWSTPSRHGAIPLDLSTDRVTVTVILIATSRSTYLSSIIPPPSLIGCPRFTSSYPHWCHRHGLLDVRGGVTCIRVRPMCTIMVSSAQCTTCARRSFSMCFLLAR